MEKVTNKTKTSKEFNEVFSTLVSIGQAKEENRAQALQLAIKSNLIRVGKGDYTEAQAEVINRVNALVQECLNDGSLDGMVGYDVKTKTLSNPLGKEVVVTSITKVVK